MPKLSFFKNILFFLFISSTFAFTEVYYKKELNGAPKNDSNLVIKPDTNDNIPDTTLKPIIKHDPLYLFVGTYTGSGSKGIYFYEMDSMTGKLSYKSAIMTVNPSFLTIHPNRKWLYSVGETGAGTISAFAIDTATEKLTLLNTVSAVGDAPCFVSTDKTGKYVLIANYSSGNVSVFPISGNGSLNQSSDVVQHTGNSIDALRQTSPHAHMIAENMVNRFVYAADLGIDKVLVYKLDTLAGKLSRTSSDATITPGSGPRHFVFHPSKSWCYVLNELKGSIEVFSVNNNTGSLARFQVISAMKDGDTNYPGSAEIFITPDSKYLYASNRGDVNSIAMYTIDQTSGKLNVIDWVSVNGKTPRSFSIDPTGKFVLVANQDSGNIVTFKINKTNGKLEPTGDIEKVPNPVCVKFW